MSDHVVWQSTVDNGAWDVCVTSPEDNWYKGTLTVKKLPEGEVILEEDVGVSYGAQFGPDVSDLAHWQQLALDAIDNHHG